MADNILVDPGTGGSAVPCATDDCGAGGHAQIVKIAYSADGVATLVTVDTNGMLVNLGANNDVTVTGTVTVDGSGVTQPVSGTFWQATQPVSLASVPSHAVTNAGTFAVQAASAGDVAHDGADSGNPVKVGAKAIAHGSNPTAVAAADRTDLYANRHGIPFVIGGHPNQKTCTYLWTGATTDDNIMAAISAGTKYVVTRLTFTLDQACTVGVAARVGFGTASVPALPAANGDAVDDILFYHPGMVPGTMHTVGDGIGILGVGGDGAELRITAGATTGGTGVVSVTYFTIES